MKPDDDKQEPSMASLGSEEERTKSFHSGRRPHEPSSSTRGLKSCWGTERRTKSGRFASTIEPAELELYYHMPVDQAAAEMGIGLTKLKSVCRNFQIHRWPYRRIKRLQFLTQRLLGGADSAQDYHDTNALLQDLQLEPNSPVWDSIGVDHARLSQLLQTTLARNSSLVGSGGDGGGGLAGGGDGGQASTASPEDRIKRETSCCTTPSESAVTQNSAPHALPSLPCKPVPRSTGRRGRPAMAPTPEQAVSAPTGATPGSHEPADHSLNSSHQRSARGRSSAARRGGGGRGGRHRSTPASAKSVGNSLLFADRVAHGNGQEHPPFASPSANGGTADELADDLYGPIKDDPYGPVTDDPLDHLHVGGGLRPLRFGPAADCADAHSLTPSSRTPRQAATAAGLQLHAVRPPLPPSGAAAAADQSPGTMLDGLDVGRREHALPGAEPQLRSDGWYGDGGATADNVMQQLIARTGVRMRQAHGAIHGSDEGLRAAAQAVPGPGHNPPGPGLLGYAGPGEGPGYPGLELLAARKMQQLQQQQQCYGGKAADDQMLFRELEWAHQRQQQQQQQALQQALQAQAQQQDLQAHHLLQLARRRRALAEAAALRRDAAGVPRWWGAPHARPAERGLEPYPGFSACNLQDMIDMVTSVVGGGSTIEAPRRDQRHAYGFGEPQRGSSHPLNARWGSAPALHGGMWQDGGAPAPQAPLGLLGRDGVNGVQRTAEPANGAAAGGGHYGLRRSAPSSFSFRGLPPELQPLEGEGEGEGGASALFSGLLPELALYGEEEEEGAALNGLAPQPPPSCRDAGEGGIIDRFAQGDFLSAANKGGEYSGDGGGYGSVVDNGSTGAVEGGRQLKRLLPHGLTRHSYSRARPSHDLFLQSTKTYASSVADL